MVLGVQVVHEALAADEAPVVAVLVGVRILADVRGPLAGFAKICEPALGPLRIAGCASTLRYEERPQEHLHACQRDLGAVRGAVVVVLRADEAGGSDEEVSIAFNPRYLQDGVSALSGDKVRIQVIDSYKPSVIDNGSDGEFLYLLMPVRV